MCANIISNAQHIVNSFRDTVNLDEIVITGTTTKVNKNNVPLTVSVISNKQLNASNETSLLPVLSGAVPGLFVTERGIMGFGVSTGAAGQISMRGIGGSPTTGVLMLIDGHPQFMGIFGHPLSDSYITSDVERVEIIRGPASVLYGSNAMGGVINIITRKQTSDGLHGSAHLMYGSYNTSKTMISGGYKKGKLSLFSSINHDQTDGHRKNSDFNLTNSYIKADYTFSRNFDASTDFSLEHFNAMDPGPDTMKAVPGNRMKITRGYWSATLNNNFEKISGTVKTFINFGEHNISDGFHSNDFNSGVNIYETVKLFKDNSISIGADFLKYGGRAENELFDTQIADTSVYDAGVYGFVQQVLFNKLTLNAGLRVQQHEIFGNKLIPSAGFAFKPLKNLTWKASVSEGFRSPTIRELFIWNHNSSLDPETVINYETGLINSLNLWNMKLELTGFMVNGNDFIITVPMQGLRNAGKISNKGLEFSMTMNPVRDLNFNLNYAYTNMKYPVFATPRHNLNLTGSYRYQNLNFVTTIQYINHLDSDPSSDSQSFETYTLVNSKISYFLNDWGEFFINLENMLNINYLNNQFYPLPRFTAFAGLKLRF